MGIICSVLVIMVPLPKILVVEHVLIRTNLDEADHFLVQDILTDIEMLEEATE